MAAVRQLMHDAAVFPGLSEALGELRACVEAPQEVRRDVDDDALVCRFIVEEDRPMDLASRDKDDVVWPQVICLALDLSLIHIW